MIAAFCPNFPFNASPSQSPATPRRTRIRVFVADCEMGWLKLPPATAHTSRGCCRLRDGLAEVATRYGTHSRGCCRLGDGLAEVAALYGGEGGGESHSYSPQQPRQTWSGPTNLAILRQVGLSKPST
ncbi:hypothetical protein [Calycomorphotria hydatis]|uniref:hypothetical protein n=1 Tax=Calycomorphotria hydatis TaxID=2528027 RepID=UPI00119DA080|nr:hypothetical protein [Calycomorphotria hydatis]